MEREKLDLFQKRLEEEKERVEKLLYNNKEDSRDDNLELTSYDNHPADIGTEVFFKEQNHGFENKNKDILKEIESSMEDIKNESYGSCRDCHKSIDEERLELIPYLKTCIECADELFPTNIRDKNTDYYRSKTGNQFDDEDSFQKVVADNIVPKDPSYSTGDNAGLSDDEEEGVDEIEKFSQEYYDESIE